MTMMLLPTLVLSTFSVSALIHNEGPRKFQNVTSDSKPVDVVYVPAEDTSCTHHLNETFHSWENAESECQRLEATCLGVVDVDCDGNTFSLCQETEKTELNGCLYNKVDAPENVVQERRRTYAAERRCSTMCLHTPWNTRKCPQEPRTCGIYQSPEWKEAGKEDPSKVNAWEMGIRWTDGPNITMTYQEDGVWKVRMTLKPHFLFGRSMIRNAFFPVNVAVLKRNQQARFEVEKWAASPGVFETIQDTWHDDDIRRRIDRSPNQQAVTCASCSWTARQHRRQDADLLGSTRTGTVDQCQELCCRIGPKCTFWNYHLSSRKHNCFLGASIDTFQPIPDRQFITGKKTESCQFEHKEWGLYYTGIGVNYVENVEEVQGADQCQEHCCRHEDCTAWNFMAYSEDSHICQLRKDVRGYPLEVIYVGTTQLPSDPERPLRAVSSRKVAKPLCDSIKWTRQLQDPIVHAWAILGWTQDTPSYCRCPTGHIKTYGQNKFLNQDVEVCLAPPPQYSPSPVH